MANRSAEYRRLAMCASHLFRCIHLRTHTPVCGRHSCCGCCAAGSRHCGAGRALHDQSRRGHVSGRCCSTACRLRHFAAGRRAAGTSGCHSRLLHCCGCLCSLACHRTSAAAAAAADSSHLQYPYRHMRARSMHITSMVNLYTVRAPKSIRRQIVLRGAPCKHHGRKAWEVHHLACEGRSRLAGCDCTHYADHPTW